jgi:hypothetical protein
LITGGREHRKTTFPMSAVRTGPVRTTEDRVVEAARLRNHVEDAGADVLKAWVSDDDVRSRARGLYSERTGRCR